MQTITQKVCDLDPSDRQLIDQEHARLESFVNNLRETCEQFEAMQNCEGCSKEKFASCQGRLTSFCYDFLDLVTEHCENEERIICKSLRIPNDKYFQRHKREHGRLLKELTDLIHEVTRMNRRGSTAEAIRRLHHWIAETFDAHAHVYDAVFLAR